MKQNLFRSMCFIAIILFSVTVHAQRGKITGTVIDKISKENLIAISATLLKAQDSTSFQALTTDLNGSFAFNKVPEGKYYLAIRAFGYEKYFKQELVISDSLKHINLGTIELDRDIIEKDGIVIVARKPFVEREAGKITVNVESDPAGTGDNVFELLKRVPGVTIENEETIKLNGKSSVLILINNKKTYLSGDALNLMLKSMQTSSVDKIEAISTPSAKYDADGVSGILNIKTKKNNNIGANGSVYASGGYSNIFKHSEGVDLSARLKDFTLFGSFGLNSYPNKSDYKSETIYPNGTSFETNTQDDERWLNSYNSTGQNYRFGTDYYINDKNTIGFVWSMNRNKSDNENTSFTRIKRDEAVDSSYKSLSDGNGDYMNNTLNFNYHHTFDSLGTEMNVDFDYSNNQNPLKSNNDINYYWGNFAILNREELTVNNTDNFTTVYSGKIDFEHPFSKKIRLESGAKASWVTNDNDLQSTFNSITDFSRTNHFIYKENIYAAYGTLNVNFTEKTGLKVGLRGEYTYNKGYLENLDTAHEQKYFNIFPNISFRQQLIKNHELGFSYRYSLYRPGYYSLNPFLYRNSQYSYSQGNPELKPQYTHNLSLSYSYKSVIFTDLSYSATKDDNTYLSYYNKDTYVSISRPQNIGKGQSLSISLNGGGKITKWWTCWAYIYGGLTASTFQYIDSTVTTQTFYSSIWVGNYFTITKNLMGEISAWGSPKTSDYFSKSRSNISVNAGLRQNLFDKKMTIRISVQDIFATSYWKREETYPSGIVYRGENHWAGRSFWLTLSYRFGKEDIKLRQRSTASQDEQSRMSSGGGSGGGGK